MKKVLISVIVPIYNAEKYLADCIDSILAQTFIDFELLLINDASTDNTIEISNQYAKKDNRIVVFDQIKNQGESVRNIGIDNAKGKYIVFIDADDLVLEMHLESLYYSSDIPSGTLVHAPHFKSKNGIVIDKKINFESNLIEDLFENKTNKFDYLFASPPWSKLIETDILLKYNIRFRSEVKMNVDHIFHLEYLQHIKAYKNIGKKSYIYFNTPNSISKKIFSFEEYLAIIELIIPRTKKVIERFNIINKQLLNNLYSTPVNAMISSILVLYRIPFKKCKIDKINALNEVLNNYSFYINEFWLPKELKYIFIKYVLKFRNIYFMNFCLGIVVCFYQIFTLLKIKTNLIFLKSNYLLLKMYNAKFPN